MGSGIDVPMVLTTANLPNQVLVKFVLSHIYQT
nr:MAG TPA: hypothetical protein [Caudoviricetes sp.]